MATNYLSAGEVLELTAPSGGVVSGVGYLVGSAFVIALGSAAQTEKFRGQRVGKFTLPKVTHATDKAFAEGEQVFWDPAEKRVDETGATHIPIGYVESAADSTAATCEVVLTGQATAVVGGG